MEVKERIANLRKLMKIERIQAYIVPSTDPHQSEYVAEAWKRREFISGFSGSAGTVVITLTHACLWTDSRYFIQAEEQLAHTSIELFRQGEKNVPELHTWLAHNLVSKDRVGFDSHVFSHNAYHKLKQSMKRTDIEFVAVDKDLVEQVWAYDQPELPRGEIRVHPLKYAGETIDNKLIRLRKSMAQSHVCACVVSSLDEIAWLCNLRGKDVAYNPVFIAYVIVYQKHTDLFIDLEKVSKQVYKYLPDDVLVRSYSEFEHALREIGDNGKHSYVWVDPDTTSFWVTHFLEAHGSKLLLQTSPIPEWKAVKNNAEIKGMRDAHIRDGVAMVRFLRWFDVAGISGKESELSVTEKLQDFRAMSDQYIGPSFATICGYRFHGAIVHYKANHSSNMKIKPSGILVLDSGAQYKDGTTDITRTISVGVPTDEQKRAYTAVLKSHLLLTRTCFLAGTDGYQLDAIAHQPLWNYGLDYRHGTGHGVGAALCVHEGPFSVSSRKNLTELCPGNILSIEPGYYKQGEYGIRIENLALVIEASKSKTSHFFKFKTLSLCPYDRRLIDKSHLNTEEVSQVDTYHANVYKALSPKLNQEDRLWLEQATRSL